jgi:thiosulfate dehydrogenase [quinone] large subunit
MTNGTTRSLGVLRAIAAARIILGLIFLWGFLDKLFGLTYTTAKENAWIDAGSPTRGYLSSSYGPLGDMFQSMAGNGLVDLLFMLGLAGVGLSLTLGIGVRIGGWSGFAMVLLMYLSHPIPWADPHTTHPFLDGHVLEAAIFVLVALTPSGDTWGLGRWWRRQSLVQKNRWLA